MKVIILGGGGFLGYRLAKTLLQSGKIGSSAIDELTLVDRQFPDERVTDNRLKLVTGDFCDPELIRPLLTQKPEVIFHLAAVVSGEAEKNFDLGMQVNLHATLQLLEICRELQHVPRIVFASSCAVYGGDVSQPVTDTTAPQPRSSYGTQKAMAELLVSDFSRRGFIDGISLRLPTIAVRPGKPNAATSSFVSSIIREPLNGIQADCPVPAETEVWIQSPSRVIDNFIHAAAINGASVGLDRAVALPGLTVSVETMLVALGEIGGQKAVELIQWVNDPFLRSIVLTWPPHFQINRARKLGFVSDRDIQEVIASYIEEEGIQNNT